MVRLPESNIPRHQHSGLDASLPARGHGPAHLRTIRSGMLLHLHDSSRRRGTPGRSKEVHARLRADVAGELHPLASGADHQLQADADTVPDPVREHDRNCLDCISEFDEFE